MRRAIGAVFSDVDLLVTPTAFLFGKSKAKLLTGDTPKVTFADVAGADEAKLELQEIIEFLKDLRGIGATGIDVHTGAALLE